MPTIRYKDYGRFLPLATLFLGGFIGWLLPIESPFISGQISGNRGGVLYESSEQFQFIDPLLACDVGTEATFPEFSGLKQTLLDLISRKTGAGDAQNISVYVRGLRSSRWMEINGSQTYAPASLLKTFVMMAYFKEANETDDPGLLDRKIRFEGSSDAEQDNPGEIIPHLVAGRYYSIDEVIKQMIVYSDNDALGTLADNFDPQTLSYFELIFKDLNIPLPTTQDEKSLNFMSVDQYAMVFRVLYGSTYLSERYSEKALSLLSQAHYKGALVAGVPSNVVVAHKFGITTVSGNQNTPSLNQLHDCGIVYYPNHPYLLCVMSAGRDFSSLQSSVKDISAATYAWLDAFYKSLDQKP